MVAPWMAGAAACVGVSACPTPAKMAIWWHGCWLTLLLSEVYSRRSGGLLGIQLDGE